MAGLGGGRSKLELLSLSSCSCAWSPWRLVALTGGSSHHFSSHNLSVVVCSTYFVCAVLLCWWAGVAARARGGMARAAPDQRGGPRQDGREGGAEEPQVPRQAWFPVFCPGLHFSASIAPGAGRMATCAPSTRPPKSTIISILAAAKGSLRHQLDFVSRNTFYKSIPALESHYAEKILPPLHFNSTQSTGRACNEERTDSSNRPSESC